MNISETDWSVSGLCVTTQPERMAEVEATLKRRPRLEVHARDPKSGRLVVVQEGSTVADHRRGLEAIQALPGVLFAELVVHYQDPDCQQQAPAKGGA